MKLRRLTFSQLSEQSGSSISLDSPTLQRTQTIIDRVRQDRDTALYDYAREFNEIGLADQEPLSITRQQLESSLDRVDPNIRGTLERTAQRIESFAMRQLAAFQSLDCDIDGGYAGHRLIPISNVGCYVPGGRYPLVSTALMTAVTARVAGCQNVSLATPKPNETMLAAAAIANVDRVLRIGGAHVIAAMACGTQTIEPVDLIVGPGNRWVTAAKKLVAGNVGIDMLAGPTELVVLADHSASPEKIAADLLAQAEHDEDARPILVSTDERLVSEVEAQLERQLSSLKTEDIARKSLATNGFVVLCSSLAEAIAVCNRLAPEHLELMCADAETVSNQIENAGCLFYGEHAAEVFGDYGVGPNHTLPTARSARFSAGLNVMNFIRIRSYVQMTRQPSREFIDDVARLAEIEGLDGHRAACELRRDRR